MPTTSKPTAQWPIFSPSAGRYQTQGCLLFFNSERKVAAIGFAIQKVTVGFVLGQVSRVDIDL